MNQVEQKHEVFTNVEDDNTQYDPIAAKQKVLNFLGFPPPLKTCGFQVLIALYTRENAKLKNADGSESILIAPTNVGFEDRFRSCTGMVIQMGSEAYQGSRFEKSGPWCRVGDWVLIGRHDGLQFDYRGRPVISVNDDKICIVLEDPNYAQRGLY